MEELERQERAIWEKLHSFCLREHISPLHQVQIFALCKEFIAFGGKSEGRTCQTT